MMRDKIHSTEPAKTYTRVKKASLSHSVLYSTWTKRFRWPFLLFLIGGLFAAIQISALAQAPAAPSSLPQQPFFDWAKTPPMGWNSWDCYGCTVNEEQTKANADYMAEKLAKFGWQYIVVDIQWYTDSTKGFNYARVPQITLDEWGRLLPVVTKFPSAADGKGFKPLGDYIHGKGLKFGVHLLRGIPRVAVDKNTPILGTDFHAADIANKKSTCPWNPDMYGVDMSKPGAQEYYNSVFKLFAEWGVDYVKVDDLSRPYHKPEVEALRKAIDASGRPMVLSTSPGNTPLSEGEHVATHANLWRVSDDFWDNWKLLYNQFGLLDQWTPYRAAGHWPDADMLPIGNVRAIEPNGWTRFTKEEQVTMLTLWCIARSPLMIGGHMPKNDAFTESLITNDEVLAVNQNSVNNRQLFRKDGTVAWIADVPESADRYLAVFYTGNAPVRNQPPVGGAPAQTPSQEEKEQTVPVQLTDLGFPGTCKIRDLWKKEDLGLFKNEFAPKLPLHGAGLYRVSPQ
jgi:hypothetical protein